MQPEFSTHPLGDSGIPAVGRNRDIDFRTAAVTDYCRPLVLLESSQDCQCSHFRVPGSQVKVYNVVNRHYKSLRMT